MLATYILTALACVAQSAVASSMTYRVRANEQACFYTDVNMAGEKVEFYFAVQAGGDFDIDWTVKNPSGELVAWGDKSREEELAFTATKTGEYAFCFDNHISTVTDKDVDFAISVENQPRAELPKKQGASAEQTSGIEESVLKMFTQTSQISRQQKYFRTREHRNMSTVQSTEDRIFWFAVLEGAAMVTVSILQVFIVRTFFSRRHSVKV